MSAAMDKRVKEIAAQAGHARQVVKDFFKQWDTGGIPSKSALSKMSKTALCDLLESYRTQPPTRGPKPLIKELVQIIMTDPELDLLSKADIVSLIRTSFTDRGLKCKIKNLDWYPSTHGFVAVPRRRINDSIL